MATPGTSSKESAGVGLEEQAERPERYMVLLLNDNFTTMEFVIEILETVFHKPHGEAVKIMLEVHRNGRGVAGVYVRQIAETKAATVRRIARAEGFPLRCEVLPE